MERKETVLYHYCTTKNFFSIINRNELWMSDICNSNDYKELTLFYPMIFDVIYDTYSENPFPFRYRNMVNKHAMSALLKYVKDLIQNQLEKGQLTSYVTCFSENNDLLSQWRAYSDDGKGFNIGISKKDLKKFCDKNKEIIVLEKVTYLTPQRLKEIARKSAEEILNDINSSRQYIINEYVQEDDYINDIDTLLELKVHGIMESFFIRSLKYKSATFKEEKEWRLYFNNNVYKDSSLVLGESKNYTVTNNFIETIKILKNKINFYYDKDVIVSYYPLALTDLKKESFTVITIGPKNVTKYADMALFLNSHRFNNVDIYKSEITYK